MPKFLDSHHMKGVDENTLRNAQNSPKDEFGVTHENIMYNETTILFEIIFKIYLPCFSLTAQDEQDLYYQLSST